MADEGRHKCALLVHGRIRDRLELDGVSIVRAQYDGAATLPEHDHEEASFCLVTSGSVVETCDQRSYELGEGSVMLRPAGSVHANTFGPEGADLLIGGLAPDEATPGHLGGHLVRRISHFTDGPVTFLALRIYRELMTQDDLTPVIVDGLVRELLVLAMRQEDHGVRSTPPWLRHVRERIRDEFVEGVSVRDMAEEAGVHPSHLSRAFKKHYGVVIGDYVRHLRVDRAADALLTTDRSIALIAHESGFFDQPHLTRVFRRHFGLTPGRFRQRAQGG